MRLFGLKGLEKYKIQLEYFLIGNETEIIQNYEQEAQSCIIKIISEYLNLPLIIENVNRETINTNEFIPEYDSVTNFSRLSKINLFFRPGHYDICYQKEYA